MPKSIMWVLMCAACGDVKCPETDLGVDSNPSNDSTVVDTPQAR
jgi:hypothetical protein